MEEEDSEIDSELFLLCRLCIMGNGKFAIVPKTQIHTAIRKIFGVKIEPYDGLSQLLCVQCKEKLMEIQNIRATFVNNQEILAALKTNYLQNRKGSVNLTIKTEPPDEVQDSTCDAETDDTTCPPETPAPVEEESTIVANCTTVTDFEKNKTNEAIKSEPNVEDSGVPIDPTENQADDMEYQYYCRLCNDKFQSVFTFKHHTESHKKLIKLQKRYTPYTCSVRAHRIDGVSVNCDSDDLQFSHPLFFIRKCNNTAIADNSSSEVRENTYTDSDEVASDNNMGVGEDFVHENSDDKAASDDDMNVGADFIPENNTKTDVIPKDNSECRVDLLAEKQSYSEGEIKSESDNTSIFQSTIGYEPWAGDYSSTFGSILRETVSVLVDEEVDRKLDSLEYVYIDKIIETIQQRITKYCRSVEEARAELLEVLMIVLCKTKLRLIWKETTSNPEILLKHSTKNCPNALDGFERVPDRPKPACMKKLEKLTIESYKQTNPGNNLEGFEPIWEKPKPASKKIGAKVTKKPLKQTNAGKNLGRLEMVQEKPKPASKKINIIMKEASKPPTMGNTFQGSEIELDQPASLKKGENYLSKTIIAGSKILIKTARIESELTNGGVTSSKTEVRPEAGTGTNKFTYSEIEIAAKEGNEFSTSDIGTASHSEAVPMSHLCMEEFDTNTAEDNYAEDESMEPETNDSENLNDSEMPVAETTMMLPIIVSTSTVDSSTMESTSVYLDLEDAQHTVNSDHFLDPVTPLNFFQHVLEKEGFVLSVEKQTPQASTLVCYKKNIENRGDLIITISLDDIVFYLDVREAKTNLDLTQENLVTQWLLLLSMTERRVETIMKNYAKRFSIDLEKIERFVKITRSISGTIRGESVWMEAPNQFFF